MRSRESARGKKREFARTETRAGELKKSKRAEGQRMGFLRGI